MGCTNSTKQLKPPPPTVSNSVGVLRVTLTNGVFFHQAGVFKMDPYAILKLANQQFESKIVHKGGKRPEFRQSFIFYINSNSKQFGRTLQITVMDKKKVGLDNFIGYGTVDLNPIIIQKKPQDQFRIILNYDYKQAGYINAVAEFIEQTYEIVTFKFDQAIIKRNTATFGAMNCWIQITIGQEILQTSKQKVTKQKSPKWPQETFTFKILKSIKQCQIKLMDDDKQIGSIITSVEKFVTSDSEQQFSEEFLYDAGLHAGTLKYHTTKQQTPIFGFMQRKSTVETRADGYFSDKVFENQMLPNPYVNQISN